MKNSFSWIQKIIKDGVLDIRILERISTLRMTRIWLRTYTKYSSEEATRIQQLLRIVQFEMAYRAALRPSILASKGGIEPDMVMVICGCGCSG